MQMYKLDGKTSRSSSNDEYKRSKSRRLDDNQLHEAVKKKDYEKVERLLQQKIFVDTEDSNKNTPLHLAVSKRDIEMVNILLNHNASVNARNIDGDTPLHLAKCPKIVELLLTKTTNLEDKNEKKETPLQLAFMNHSEEIVLLLIKAGASIHYSFDLNKKSKKLWPLHAALEKKMDKVAELIIRTRLANLNEVNNTKETPLHVAARKTNIELVKLILHVFDLVNTQPDRKKTFLNARDNNGDTPLHAATKRKNGLAIVDYLMSQGADVNIVNNLGENPLHIACSTGDKIMVWCLVRSNVDLNRIDHQGKTPLQYAILKESKDIIRILSIYGADMSKYDHVVLSQKKDGQNKVIQDIKKFLHKKNKDEPIADEYTLEDAYDSSVYGSDAYDSRALVKFQKLLNDGAHIAPALARRITDAKDRFYFALLRFERLKKIQEEKDQQRRESESYLTYNDDE